MSAPYSSSSDNETLEMFDSYCKTVLHNASINIKRKIANQTKLEYLTDTPSVYLGAREDKYPSHEYIIYARDFNCIVSDERLYNALVNLPTRERAVLMLDFWQNWTDVKIAGELEVSIKTVYNLRQRAYSKIKNYFKG